jgi:putative ABC transport system ATP-binding protein
MRAVERIYQRGASRVVALQGIDLDVREGESVAVMGRSGSGKSTLLGLLGCLDRPSSGGYVLAGADVGRLSDTELSRIRNRTVGFVFQAFHLIPRLSVAENVETPLLYSDVPQAEWHARALDTLERVGLGPRADHRPGELSGGEAQRAAIARALVNEPRLILADEPTGNLDSATGSEIAELLFSLNASGTTLVVVTHEAALADRASRRLSLRDGRLEA